MNAPDETAAAAAATPTAAATAAAPGVLLREARERAGLSQEDIASKLKLAPRQIAAIETGDWNALPERTFTRGFMRSYARAVGLDPNIVGLDRSPSQPHAGGELKPTPDAIGEIARVIERSRSSASRWAVPLLLVAVLVAGVTYFQWGELIGLKFPKWSTPSTPNAGAKGAAATKPDTGSGSAPVASAPALIAPDKAGLNDAATPPGSGAGGVIAPNASLPSLESVPATATAIASPSILTGKPAERRISITFKGKSWTEVRSKGDVIYSEASLPGTKEFSGAPPLSFIVGNASIVELKIDGKPYDMTNLTRNDVARFRIE